MPVSSSSSFLSCWRPWPHGSLSSLLLCVLFVWISLPESTSATQVHYIHWNSSNPIFRIDNTDHIFDVNAGVRPGEYDQANIICPVYKPGTQPQHSEQYKIYAVSKEEYDTCRITNPHPRVIAVCNKPSQLMYFTITFRSFTPTPGGMEFQPGKDYYFISTSSDTDLDRRIGGRCTTHNMKVIFKVAASDQYEADDRAEEGEEGQGEEEAGADPDYYYPLLDAKVEATNHLDEDETPSLDYNSMYRRRQQRGEIIKQEASRMQQATATATSSSSSSASSPRQGSPLAPVFLLLVTLLPASWPALFC